MALFFRKICFAKLIISLKNFIGYKLPPFPGSRRCTANVKSIWLGIRVLIYSVLLDYYYSISAKFFQDGRSKKSKTGNNRSSYQISRKARKSLRIKKGLGNKGISLGEGVSLLKDLPGPVVYRPGKLKYDDYFFSTNTSIFSFSSDMVFCCSWTTLVRTATTSMGLIPFLSFVATMSGASSAIKPT